MAETALPVHATAVTPRPLFSEGYKRVVLITLTLVYTLNFLDRSVVNIIGHPRKVSFGITDGQLGLLNGLAFAVLYTLLGVPIARLAERWSRVNIVAVCIVLWSGFTVHCGLAPNFAAMLAFRAGVGVGEAGCSPPSHSLISDYYAPKRRASAVQLMLRPHSRPSYNPARSALSWLTRPDFDRKLRARRQRLVAGSSQPSRRRRPRA